MPAMVYSDESELASEPEAVTIDLPTTDCLDTARTANDAEKDLYSSHAYMQDPEFDVTTADGAEQWGQIRDDFDRKWNELMEPLYFECSSPDDFWAALQEYPEIAGATEAEYIISDIVEVWCYDRSDNPPMCQGWDEWEVP
ncbi:hypothetical protein [Agrococcus casei]|uniref:hypothetical protein n=1 Tax=Agrococcus casei TaxID=343512 RepID=UPI003F9202B9